MPETISRELEKQIEEAYDFRGYATIRLKDGTSLEAFIFNRQFENPRLERDYFIEVFPKDGGDRRTILMRDIASIATTGKDYAQPFTPPHKNQP